MTTKFELEEPYRSRWERGYLNINSQGRRTVYLYNSHSDRTSTQYARYKMAVSLGRFLEEHETVDHIDEDKTNDALENLQVLSRAENTRKANKLPDVDVICAVCGITFTRSRTKLRGKFDKAMRGELTCSRSCGAKKAAQTLKDKKRGPVSQR